MYEAAHAGADGRADGVTRSVDRDALKLLPRSPVADLGGRMVDDLAAGTGRIQRSPIGYVADCELDSLCLEPGAIAARSHERTNGKAAFAELLDNVAAEQAVAPVTRFIPKPFGVRQSDGCAVQVVAFNDKRRLRGRRFAGC